MWLPPSYYQREALTAAKAKAKQQDEEDAQLRKAYHDAHRRCPRCGSKNHSSTLMGYVTSYLLEYGDHNRATCEDCKWHGVVHDLLPEALLKLYVWEHVLQDYGTGIVVVLAETEEQAWSLLREKDDTAWWSLGGNGRVDGRTMITPRVVESPEAFVVWGGG